MTNVSVSHPDGEFQRLLDVLDHRGAAEYMHSGNRMLKDHLLGTYEILRTWKQPTFVCHAGLFHSAYATEAFVQPLFDIADRTQLLKFICPQAEERVALFCSISRRDLLRQLKESGCIPSPGLSVLNFRTNQHQFLSQKVIADLVVIEMANVAEQRPDEATLPMHPISTISRLGQLVRNIPSPPPIFNKCTEDLSPDDEARARDLYREGLNLINLNLSMAQEQFKCSSLHNPWIAEPYIYLGLIALDSGNYIEANQHAYRSFQLLTEWGTSWDKSRSLDEWIRLAKQVATLSEKGCAPL